MFFQDVFNAFAKHVNFDTIKSVVIVSLASTKDEFRELLLLEAKRLKMNDSMVMNMIKDSDLS